MGKGSSKIQEHGDQEQQDFQVDETRLMAYFTAPVALDVQRLEDLDAIRFGQLQAQRAQLRGIGGQHVTAPVSEPPRPCP